MAIFGSESQQPHDADTLEWWKANRGGGSISWVGGTSVVIRRFGGAGRPKVLRGGGSGGVASPDCGDSAGVIRGKIFEILNAIWWILTYFWATEGRLLRMNVLILCFHDFNTTACQRFWHDWHPKKSSAGRLLWVFTPGLVFSMNWVSEFFGNLVFLISVWALNLTYFFTSEITI
jgi:hypothetical protein